MGNLVAGVCADVLFPRTPTIFFHPQYESCPRCGCKLKVLKTREKTVVTMDIGPFIAKETVLHCPHDQLVFCSDQLRALAPYKGIFGYDVIVYVGKALFTYCRNNQEIMKNLAAKNIIISEREISYLGRKFIIYLALAYRESRKNRKERYVKMIKLMDKYWNKLFADPMVVHTPEGETIIVPQRTNNILSHLQKRIFHKQFIQILHSYFHYAPYIVVK